LRERNRKTAFVYYTRRIGFRLNLRQPGFETGPKSRLEFQTKLLAFILVTEEVFRDLYHYNHHFTERVRAGRVCYKLKI
jgi:hypothetical protein